ncbi:MAG: hypothetical protein Q9176_005221 [Flavoplaca citrina]
MSLLASSSSSSTNPPNFNWQQMPDSSHWRATYSNQAREEAGNAARDAYAEHVRGIRELEKIPTWAEPFMDKHDRTAEKSFELGKMLYDAADAHWGVGEDKYKAAYNQPWTVGVRPDLACPADSAGCLSRKEGGAIDVVPSPEGEGSNALEGPGGDGERNEDDPTEKNEWPEGMDEDPDLTEPIINDDEEVKIDLEGELEATPVLKDETTRTAMQKCQEREEKKLWDEIGSTTIDPNTEFISEEDRRAQAENGKRLGFCDKSYYGEDGCREWKRQLDSVPLPPESKLELESQLQSQPDLCPVNLVKLTDCQRAKQSVYMRFAILDETAQAVDSKFKPGRPVDIIPRLDFLVPCNNVTGTTGAFQVQPLGEEKDPAITDKLTFKPVSIPRVPESIIPKPSTPPGSAVPNPRPGTNPFDFGTSTSSAPGGGVSKPRPGTNPLDTGTSGSGADSPRLPGLGSPGAGVPKTPGVPAHKMPQGENFEAPAIGGHTIPPWRLPGRKLGDFEG